MKKLFLLLASVALVTACEDDGWDNGYDSGYDNGYHDGYDRGLGDGGDFQKLVINNINVAPGDWQRMGNSDGLFDYYYADKTLPGFTNTIFNTGLYQMYFKYLDEQVSVQEGMGISFDLERYDEDKDEWITYTEHLACSYSEGFVRFALSRSDFWDGVPTQTLAFRFVAFY